MRNFVYLLVLLTIFFVAPTFAGQNAYIVNSLAESLSEIDLESGTVSNHVTSLGEAPNQVVYHDGYLYVVNSISADIMKIDPVSFQVVATVYLPIGSNPYNMTFYGDYGYATGWISGLVYKFSLSTNSVVDDVNVGNFPEGIIYHDGLLYVTRTNFNPDNYSYGQGDIAVVDPLEMSLSNIYNVGTNPQWISVAPDNNLHIVCTGNYADIEGSVYIFDPSQSAISDSIMVGGQLLNLAVTTNGIGYLAAGGWISDGHVYSYNTYTGEILNGPTNPILVGMGSSSIAADSDGFIYSCDFGDDSISKISPSGQVTATFGVGDGPYSIITTGSSTDIADQSPDALPKNVSLLSNYPNPFNGGTIISYDGRFGNGLAEVVAIYDVSGRLVNKIPIELSGNSGEVYWDGTNSELDYCPSGIYFAKIMNSSNNFETNSLGGSLKMTLVK